MIRRRGGALLSSTAIKAGLLVAVALVGGMLAADRAEVGAAASDAQVTGTLSLETSGGIVIDDGSATYGLVGAMDLSPFLGRTVALDGGIDDGTLYVQALTLGAIDLEDQQGRVTVQTTGTVEQTSDGYQVTVEGIAFTLVGSDELDQVVGEEAQIEGELIGTWITLTSLRTADGQEIETHPPDLDEAEPSTDPCCDQDDG